MINVPGFVRSDTLSVRAKEAPGDASVLQRCPKQKAAVTEREMKKCDLGNRGKTMVKPVYQRYNEGPGEEGFMGLRMSTVKHVFATEEPDPSYPQKSVPRCIRESNGNMSDVLVNTEHKIRLLSIHTWLDALLRFPFLLFLSFESPLATSPSLWGPCSCHSPLFSCSSSLVHLPFFFFSYPVLAHHHRVT